MTVNNFVRAHYPSGLRLVSRSVAYGACPISAEVLYGSSLMIAQGIKSNSTSGQLNEVVAAFVSVRPDNPTVAKFENLINRLAAPYCPLRVRQINDGHIDVWEVTDHLQHFLENSPHQSDASTIRTHSSNESAGQLLSTLRELGSYGRGAPPNQLTQPWQGIQARGTSNSLITNVVPAGKSEALGSTALSLIVLT
jgi:hypothetical protein